ncbi:MFS general substrate transporter [Mycena chlorophos]|uniref:MFS general substrate transporter n=1 Tax=Mycena chlorophos TaxID=658473 RepID=A0A8H6SI83_MYCCL|nr:MFS general substrate transporter [Mycena chlorophos]
MINRFVLGLFEASVSPGFTLMTGWWYTRKEVPLRQFIWYSGLGWGGVIGSYVSTGISTISPTAPGPQKWQYIFYILGGVTMLWAIVVYVVLPDSPVSARWLTPRQRVLAVQRVAGNHLGIKNRRFKREQVWVALRDVKIWILFVSVWGAAIPNGVVSNFSAIIIEDMGFSQTKTTVLTAVGNIILIVALVLGGLITLNGANMRLFAATTANLIRVVAAVTMPVGFGGSYGQLEYGRIYASFGGDTAYCFGNAAGPFVVKQSQAPFYQDATAGLLAGYTVKLVCQLSLLVYMYRANRRRDAKYGPPDVDRAKEAGMQDKTEFENKDFRYVL